MLISVRVSNLILGVVGEGRGRRRGVVRRKGRGVVVGLVNGGRAVVEVVVVVVVVGGGGGG